MWRLRALILATLLFTACGGETANGGATPEGSATVGGLCVAGSLQACTCADAQLRQQSCALDGSGWLPCECALKGGGGDTGAAQAGSGGAMAMDAGSTQDAGADAASDAGQDASSNECSETIPPGPPSSPSAPQPSSGCGMPAPSDGVTMIMVGSENRSYILELPNGYDPGKAYPLVFGFHGATSSAAQFASDFYGGLGPAVESEAIVVYPEAEVRDGVKAWQISGSEDLAFFDALVGELNSSLCVDAGRIFSTGHSSGGYFTNRLGCSRGNVLRGIAPLAGGGPFGGCTGQVAVWIEHGDMDERVSLSAGEGSRDYWTGTNGCQGTSSFAYPCDCQAYGGCDPNYPVHFCVSAGAGHEPRANFTGTGAWQFFRSLP